MSETDENMGWLATGLELHVKAISKSYPVWLDVSGSGHDPYRSGKFVIRLGEGNELRADSYSDLWHKAASYKAERFQVPFSQARPNGVNEGIVTGFHASNGSMLIAWGARGHGQMRSYEAEGAMPRLTAEETAELGHLISVRNQAAAAVEAFIAAHPFPEGKLEDAARAAQLKVRGE